MPTRPASAPFRAIERSSRPLRIRIQVRAPHEAGGRREVGHEDDSADLGVDGELRAAVEAKPTEPEDEHAERGEREVVRGHRLDRAIRHVLANARADDQGACQGHASADTVNDRAPGEVDEAHFREPAAAPDPVTDHRVDDDGRDRGEEEEGQQPSALGDRARHDRAGGRREDELKEEKYIGRQVRLGSPVVREEAREPHEGVAFAEHHAVAHQIEDDRRNRDYTEVLHQHHHRIFPAAEPALDESEARVHEENECGANENPQCVCIRCQFRKLFFHDLCTS